MNGETGGNDKLASEARRDFFSSIVLMAISIAVGIRSLRMPRPGGWSDAPGLIPLFLASCIFVMSLSLLASSLKKKSFNSIVKRFKGFKFHNWKEINEKSKRSIVIIGITIFYIVALIGRIPFEFASFIYLLVTFKLFWKKVRLLNLIIISIFVPLAISLIFRGILVIFMPGGSIANWIITSVK